MVKFKHKSVDIDATILKEDIYFSLDSGRTQVYGKRGEFLVTGVDGKLYLCPNDVFKAIYDPVDEEGNLLFLDD